MLRVQKGVKQDSFRQQCFCFWSTEISRQLKAQARYVDYTFIDFDERALDSISTYEFALANCWGKCVLVSSKRLLPLAVFYYQHFWFISTVIEVGETIDSSVKWLSHLNGAKGLSPRLSTVPHFSQIEVIILDGFMAGKSTNMIAKALDKNPKTIYGYRKKIALKMGLKKLEKLFVFNS